MNRLNQAMQSRLRFIDFTIEHFGYVNRSHIEDFFGVSKPQATLDLSEYQACAPLNVLYDKSERRYVKSSCFMRVFP